MTEENDITKKGILISFEGSEGCGKSTQIRRIADRLEAIDHCEVVVTREPGGTEIGEEIRHLLMHSASNAAMVDCTCAGEATAPGMLVLEPDRTSLAGSVTPPTPTYGSIMSGECFIPASVARMTSR